MVSYTASAAGLEERAVRSLLDEASAREPSDLSAVATDSRLAAYALALSRLEPREPVSMLSTVLLRPNATMLSAWSIAAAAAGVSLERWAEERLRAPALCDTAWEVSAASGGQTLAEWALDQATRSFRALSTAPQTAA